MKSTNSIHERTIIMEDHRYALPLKWISPKYTLQ